MCVSDEPPSLEELNCPATGRVEWITLASVQADQVERVTADLLAFLYNSWLESKRPNLLLATLDALLVRCCNHACGMGVMNGGKRSKSDQSTKQFELNLPALLAHLPQLAASLCMAVRK